MNTRTLLAWSLAIGLLGALPAANAAAAQSLLTEMPDPDLAALRGRFMVDNNTVAYFGVSMLSSWAAADGQQLQGSATLGMHFAPDARQPRITFTPTLTIVQGMPIAVPATGVVRSVDGSGLANVNGLLQGIQVAGNGNHALNVATVSVRDATADPGALPATGSDAPFASRMVSGDASVAVAFDPARGISLDLGIAGQGMVSQWIRAGSVGQLAQLTADGQAVSNVLQLDLVLNRGDSSRAALNGAAQALLQARANAPGGWQ